MLNGSLPQSVVNFRGPLVRDMIAAGHRVTAVAPDITPELAQQIRALGAEPCEVPLKRGGTNPLSDLLYYRALKDIVGRIRPDLVLSYTIKPNIWGSLAAEGAGVRSAAMVTGLGYTFIQRDTFKQRAIGAISRRLYSRATAANDVVVFQNTDDRDDFIAAGCLRNPGKARLVNGSGVDVEYFAPASLPEQPVFLMIARLLVSKGAREYAAAAMQVMQQRSDCRFLLAGDLDATPDSISADELKRWRAGGIEHLGWIDDVRSSIAQSSIYVLPSYREGTPRTVLEASAMGRAAIVTDAPGCRETVVDGETGLLVPPRDVGALVDAMLKMADDANFRRTAGAAARKFCETKYAVGKVNRQLMDHLGL